MVRIALFVIGVVLSAFALASVFWLMFGLVFGTLWGDVALQQAGGYGFLGLLLFGGLAAGMFASLTGPS